MKNTFINQQRLTIGLFIVYLIVLVWIIIFKMSFSLSGLPNIRNINLIPFAESVIINDKLNITEIIYNALIFVPFGLYLSILKYKWSFLRQLSVIFCTSFLFETFSTFSVLGRPTSPI